MSEKITFGELIETIAEETDRSKQFTHDFLKDFVDVINGGLEEDGKVNIAGFGKFELRRVDEREGFNPQTEEKITIPAHNKIVFKPYKDLRELVNAPYAHIEPKLIDQDHSTTSDEDNSTGQSQASDDSSNKDLTSELSSDKSPEPTELSDNQESDKERSEDDFIPTAPPTSHTESQDTLEDDPFGFDENQNYDDTEKENAPEEQSDSSESDDNGDIVEFNSEKSSGEDVQDETLDAFVGSEEEQDSDSESEDENKVVTENNTESQEPTDTEDETQQDKSTEKTEEEVLAEEVEKLEDTAEQIKQEHAEEHDVEDSPEKAVPSKKSDRSSAYLYVAAAVVILALIAGGAWYYSTLSTNNTTMISSTETTEATTDRQQNNDSQQETADEQQSTSTQNQQQSSTSQNQSTTNAGSSVSDATQQQQNETAIELEKGQTLWSIAEERYGNPRLWPWIYGKNESLEDPDVIYAGNSLSVPLPSGPQNTLNATDSVGVAKGFLATYKWYKSNEEEQAKNHLWAAKSYHTNLKQIADIPIDQADLSYVNKAR